MWSNIYTKISGRNGIIMKNKNETSTTLNFVKYVIIVKTISSKYNAEQERN